MCTIFTLRGQNKRVKVEAGNRGATGETLDQLPDKNVDHV